MPESAFDNAVASEIATLTADINHSIVLYDSGSSLGSSLDIELFNDPVSVSGGYSVRNTNEISIPVSTTGNITEIRFISGGTNAIFSTSSPSFRYFPDSPISVEEGDTVIFPEEGINILIRGLG